MQNLLADRMGALRTPSFESGENNPTFGEKNPSNLQIITFRRRPLHIGNLKEIPEHFQKI